MIDYITTGITTLLLQHTVQLSLLPVLAASAPATATAATTVTTTAAATAAAAALEHLNMRTCKKSSGLHARGNSYIKATYLFPLIIPIQQYALSSF